MTLLSEAMRGLSYCGNATRSSPSVIWQTMAFSMGGPMVFDPGCMMRSRIETVLKPGTMDGVSPSYARTTTPGHGVVSFVARGLRSFTTAAEAAANPSATADLRFTFWVLPRSRCQNAPILKESPAGSLGPLLLAGGTWGTTYRRQALFMCEGSPASPRSPDRAPS
jgi:hypothetical protein